MEQPQLADKCDKWNEFDSDDWTYLLMEQPQFADKCDKNWSKLLNASPEMIANYNWSELGAMDWGNLLYVRPEFADNCNKWVEIFFTYDEMRFELLRKHPELIEKYHGLWEKLTGHEMFWCLLRYPELAKESTWSKIYPGRWAYLLWRHREIMDHVKLDFSIFSRTALQESL